MANGAERLSMPHIPLDLFMEAVNMAVVENADWVPPLGDHLGVANCQGGQDSSCQQVTGTSVFKLSKRDKIFSFISRSVLWTRVCCEVLVHLERRRRDQSAAECVSFSFGKSRTSRNCAGNGT
eukprot:6472297-Amphidinium_carterae.1